MNPVAYKGNFFGGRFRRPAPPVRRLVSEDPGNLSQPVGEIAFSPRAVDAAVQAARKAFPLWAATPFDKRAEFILRFRAALGRHADSTALIMSRETGKPLAESKLEIDRILAKAESAIRYEPALLPSFEHESAPGLTGRVTWKPRGVIAILAPFNVPAHLASSQSISAILTGNTVVVKPSELTPFTGQAVAEAWEEAGLPAGVFNLVQGDGPVGKELVAHPGVAGVFFTGSWETGSRIEASLAGSPEKICALEMGGKNAAIVLANCDLEEAVRETAGGAFMTTGQRCNATSRILVEKSVARDFIAAFLKKTDSLKIGYATEPDVFMGPLASQKGLDRVLSFLKKAPREGFEVLRPGGILSGPRPGGHVSGISNVSPGTWSGKRGYYVKPSVHLKKGPLTGPVRDGSYADDEVFGPDAAIYVVKNLDEAIALHNRPRYGLAASIFTRSRAAFERVLAGAEAGVVNWNVATTRSSSRLPFGGLKRSGNHRPAGFFSPYFCTVPTASVEKNPS